MGDGRAFPIALKRPPVVGALQEAGLIDAPLQNNRNAKAINMTTPGRGVV